MTTRTYTDKNGNEWSWEENEKVLEAIKQLHQPPSQEQQQVLST
jgi:hypothetical protein